jgi:hypothetical protein
MRNCYIAQNARYVLDMSGHNRVVCTAATVRGVQGIFALFSAEPGEQKQVRREVLLQAAKDLLARVEADFDRLQYTYSRRDERFGSSGSGMIGGIRIGGKLYSLEGGPGTCLLEEIGIDASGQGQVVKAIDVRSEKVIETENFGRITITKRKKRLTIHHQLKGLIAFLQQQEDEYITKTLDEGLRKPMDWIRGLEAAEGLEEDYFKERLHEFGDKGLEELIARYAEPLQKHKQTIQFVLQNFYAPVEVQRRVESAAAAENDPERKRVYVDLLDSLRRTLS